MFSAYFLLMLDQTVFSFSLFFWSILTAKKWRWKWSQNKICINFCCHRIQILMFLFHFWITGTCKVSLHLGTGFYNSSFRIVEDMVIPTCLPRGTRSKDPHPQGPCSRARSSWYMDWIWIRSAATNCSICSVCMEMLWGYVMLYFVSDSGQLS